MFDAACNLGLIVLWSAILLFPHHSVANPDFTLVSTRPGGNTNSVQDLPGCYLGGQHYMFGERWSPVMEPRGLVVCLKCECLQVEKKGIVQTRGETVCRNVKDRCPHVTCSKPRTLPGRCCKICAPEDDFEANLTFRQERPPLHPPEHLPSDDSQVYTGTRVYSALLTGTSSSGTSELSRSGGEVTSGTVAAVRLTMTSSTGLDFAARVASSFDPMYQQARYLHLQLVDSEGGVQLQRPLGKLPSKGEKKICGTWNQVPSIYGSYLHNGQLTARIITSSVLGQNDGAISGTVVPDSGSRQEVLSAVLTPTIPDGSGARVSVSYLPRTRTAVFTLTTSGLDFDIGGKAVFRLAVTYKSRILFQTPRLVLSKFNQLTGTWQMRRKRHRRLLARGKLRMRVLREGKSPKALLEGVLNSRLSCDELQAVATETSSPGVSVVSAAVVSLEDKGRLRFKIQVKGPTQSYPAQIFLDGSRPGHGRHEIWRRPFPPARLSSPLSTSPNTDIDDEWISGKYTKLDMSTLYRLLHNRMYVTVAFGDDKQTKGALVSPGERLAETDTEAVWLTLPPATDSEVRGESAAAHLQLSLKPDCTLRLSGLVSPSRGQRVEVKVTLAMAGGGSEDQRSSIKEEWRAEVKARTKFVRGYAVVNGEFTDLPGKSLLALDRGYAYLQLTLRDLNLDQLQSQTKRVQIRLPNGCWRHRRGSVITEDSLVTSVQLRDEGSFEQQKDPTATQEEAFGASGEAGPPPNCTFEGQEYEEGSAWLPDVYAKCTTCSCVKSQVMCQRMICPTLSCQNPVVVEGECCPSCPADGSLETCRLGQDPRIYRVDTTWHPYLPLEGFTRCAICTCQPGGRAVCTKTECPALPCDRSLWVKSETDPCCYTCAPELSTAPPTLPPQQDVDMQGACFVRGQLRRDGETWNPTVQTFGLMKCIECHCRAGSFKCEFLKCPKLTCVRRKKPPNVCCEVCEDGSSNSVEKQPKETLKKHKRVPTQTTTKKSKKIRKRKRKACKMDRIVYAHGERWRPRTSDTHDNCVVCRCQNGKAKCRMRCPRTCETDRNSHRCCKHCGEKPEKSGEKVTKRTEAVETKLDVSTSVSVFERRTNLIHFLQ